MELRDVKPGEYYKHDRITLYCLGITEEKGLYEVVSSKNKKNGVPMFNHRGTLDSIFKNMLPPKYTKKYLGYRGYESYLEPLENKVIDYIKF